MKKKLLIGLASLVALSITVSIIVLATAPRGVLTLFAVSNLNVSPTEVEPEETVIVTMDIRNAGEEKGTCELELMIDGVVEQSKNVTLDAGETTSISFLLKIIEGSYNVELAGLTGVFAVVPTPL